jgi:hypothetical protein
VADDYITLEEAALLSGLHLGSLKRLLRSGQLRGYKQSFNGRKRWMVSVRSLRQYTDPYNGYLLDLPGPKLYLRRVDDDDEAADAFLG